jgi:signal transduction histidine kinase/DNA-binding NarL/FixJ family response regulator
MNATDLSEPVPRGSVKSPPRRRVADAIGGRTANGAARATLPLLAAFLVPAVLYVYGQAYGLQRELGETARDHAIWSVSQAITAYARLHQAVTAPRDPNSADEVRARYDTFSQRVLRLRDGQVGKAVDSLPEMRPLAARLDADRVRTRELVNQIGSVQGRAEVSRRMTDETAELVRLAEQANRTGVARAELDQLTLQRLRRLLTSLLVALVLTGLLLIVNLVRRIRELNATQAMLRSTADGLREALEAAGRADVAKARFIATVSHEIRTPMNAVMGLADTLLEDGLRKPQHEMVDMIRESGGSLLRMLDDILDYSKLDSGRMTLEAKPFSPDSVTAATVATIGSRARAKGLTIVAIPAPGLPKSLVGDAGRIGQILLNLASNAVKFTETGGVTLQVLCPDRDQRHAVIEWVVTDTGVGIAESRIDNLFNDFVQADETIAGRYGGTGLGLAICRRLVSQMGGTISVESALGEGSRFRVRLPFQLAPTPPDRVEPPASASEMFRARLRAMGRPPRILIAEDNATNQFVIRQILAREGVTPELVGDGRAAVEAAAATCYDVICMDMRMPGMDGLEASRLIRSGQGASAATPIIALTASAFPEDVQACRDAGMDLFVPKPVRKEGLLDALLHMMREHPVGPENADRAEAMSDQPAGSWSGPLGPSEGARQTVT